MPCLHPSAAASDRFDCRADTAGILQAGPLPLHRAHVQAKGDGAQIEDAQSANAGASSSVE